MAELNNVDAPLEGITPEQAQTEIAQIRGDKSNPYWQNEGSSIGGNPLAKKWQDRMSKLYSIAYPETPERKTELPENRSLHDRIVQTGLKSSEQIEEEGQAPWIKMSEQEREREYLEAEGQLRNEWGPEYQSKLSTVHYMIDNVASKEDRGTLIEHLGNDLDFIQALAIVGSKMDSIFWQGKAKSYKRKGQ